MCEVWNMSDKRGRLPPCDGDVNTGQGEELAREAQVQTPESDPNTLPCDSQKKNPLLSAPFQLWAHSHENGGGWLQCVKKESRMWQPLLICWAFCMNTRGSGMNEVLLLTGVTAHTRNDTYTQTWTATVWQSWFTHTKTCLHVTKPEDNISLLCAIDQIPLHDSIQSRTYSSIWTWHL